MSIYGKNFLATSINKPKEDINSAQFQAELKKINTIPGTGNMTRDLKIISKEIKNGVCQAGCLEFADKFHELKKMGPVNEEDLIKLAKQFKSGISHAGVAHQVAYRHLCDQTNYFRSAEPIKDYINVGSGVGILKK